MNSLRHTAAPSSPRDHSESGGPDFDLDTWVARSGAVDLDAVPWAEVPAHPVPADAVRALRYMQDIESHTVIYLRSLLATRADRRSGGRHVPGVLAPRGDVPRPRPGALPRGGRAPARATGAAARTGAARQAASRRPSLRALSRAWPDFCAVHMTWGAINELTTLTGLSAPGRPRRTPGARPSCSSASRATSRGTSSSTTARPTSGSRRPGAARMARFLVDRFWAPVGSGVQPPAELALPGPVPVRWGRRPSGRSEGGRRDPPAARIPGRRPARGVDGQGGRPWRPRRLSHTGPTLHGPSRAASATR